MESGQTNRRWRRWRHIAVAAAAAGAGIFQLPGALAQATTTCELYARTSLQQARQNVKTGCGFGGASWAASLAAHRTFCRANAPAAWKARVRERNRLLADCKR